MKSSVYQWGRFLLRAAADEKQAADTWPADVQTSPKIRRGSLFFNRISAGYLLVVDATTDVSCRPRSLQKLFSAARDTGAGLIYSDFRVKTGKDFAPHPLNDYQPGSIRENFNFGHFFILSVAAVQNALKKYGPLPSDPADAFYDLRLKISIDHPLLHVPKVLYTVADKKRKTAKKTGRRGEEQFAYVAGENALRQKKLEKIATAYLKLIDAHLPPRTRTTHREAEDFQWKASIIIPVLNREKTIADALTSALSQKTNFAFNVIVVDNHSTDGTTSILKQFAAKHPHVQHIIPKRRNLGIGGCWNEAMASPFCGRYAVQLDSDDLYSSPSTLQKIVNKLRQGPYAMVVGSYTLVNEKLKPIPPGLIDHREWTPGNGHNNLLRVNGMGAPRAFDTSVLRQFAFPNVSYGEDYAMALRISREYRIGRIYESLYLCRRWSDNTDAGLSLEKQNRNDAYKDRLRTMEIRARQQVNERERSTQATRLRKNVKNQNEHRHSRAGGNPELFNTGFRDALRLPGMTNKKVTMQSHKPDWQAVSGPSPATGYIFAEFPGEGGVTLPALSHIFFESQKESWPGLSLACRDLACVQTRELVCGNDAITLQYNPARQISSGAALDKESIRKRPCFLCVENQPPEQQGILYRDTYLILCNPAPIFDHHFTVGSLTHEPQDITSSFDMLVQMAMDASPDYTVFYNGPACGASAPDHLHFQMIPYEALPFLKELTQPPMIKIDPSVRMAAGKSCDRSVVVMESKNAAALKKHFLRFLKIIQTILSSDDEPLINVFCSYEKDRWQVISFLRRKHRPAAYFAEGDQRIFVSPGAIDMAGVVITPRLADFENLDGDTLQSIYREVSLDKKTFKKIIRSLTPCPQKKSLSTAP
jgi:glycosyltransferase involved in cell wall biosynthesis